MKTSQKKKRCHFFCYEGAVEAKIVRKSVKSQGLRDFSRQREQQGEQNN